MIKAMTEREDAHMMIKTSDIVAVGFGSAKALASRVPILNEILAGFDSYKRARFEPETEEFLQHLYTALDRVEQKFEPSWFTTHEGDIFARKVLDCAVDAQLADKKELFANALVSGRLMDEPRILRSSNLWTPSVIYQELPSWSLPTYIPC
jgi:hypothetical protein